MDTLVSNHLGLFLFVLIVILLFWLLFSTRDNKLPDGESCGCDEPCNSKSRDLLLMVKVNTLNGPIFIKGKNMSIIARNDQTITFNPVFQDAFGNEVTNLDVAPQWSISREDLAQLEVSEDGLSATVVPLGATGTLQVNVLIDAIPGEGEEALVGVAEVQILAGKVSVIRLDGVVKDKVAEPVEPEPEPETPNEPQEPEAQQ